MQEVGLKQTLQRSRKRESPLSEQQQKQNLPAKRWNVESQSHRGFLSALYTSSTFYFTLLVLNCTPWMRYVCHLSAFLPGCGIEQFLLSSSWDGGWSVLYWISPWIHFTIRTRQREVKRRQEQKEKIGGCTALLSLVWMHIKFNPNCYDNMGNSGSGDGRITRRTW